MLRLLCVVAGLGTVLTGLPLHAAWQAGFSRLDITPAEPLRLSGYGSRTKPSEGVDTPLYVRCLVFRAESAETNETAGPLHVLLSVDTIGFPTALTSEIVEAVAAKHPVSRERLVVCGTHSHTAPHISRGLENLFSHPPTEPEREALSRYTDAVRDQCIAAVDQALADMQPAKLYTATGEGTFAQNRRVIEGGVWKGFGVNPEGPVDHSLPVMKWTTADGKSLRGIVFNYACHCTTFGGDYNRVNGDWAGYAARAIESAHEGVVALSTIGAGADQNPPRDPARALEFAQAEGREIADEVDRLLQRPWQEITDAPVARFGFAGLPIDRPGLDELRAALNDNRPQVRRHAEIMLEIHARMGRLPESYPMPIHLWRFADQFCMVFLGGEVVVDYAYLIREALGPSTWVSAYSNDVFGYVASERMRSEGGYEVDYSMIYYLQPGRWSSGTQDVILERVRELYEGRNLSEPLSLDDALRSFHLNSDYCIEIVAAEPEIADPVNFAVGPDGRLWVVEMGDYPRGARGGVTPHERQSPWDGLPAGRIRVLSDDDGDGRYERAELFAEGLSFPTGIVPWRNGVIVSAAPEILFLADTDGDGRADMRQPLCRGFAEANPQHRVNGFEWGLDGWLHLASDGSSTEVEWLAGENKGVRTKIGGRDFRIHPASGAVEPMSGRSQYGRCRDEFGNWYGNTNSEPLFHLILGERELKNPHVASPAPRVFLTDPPRAPRVYPTSRTADRFNDLFAANRFTSACSPCVVRNDSFAPCVTSSVFVCEPVHNLVSRVIVEYDGLLPTGRRSESEVESEFLSSTDPWFRPVRLMTGPDGSLWVCDMYRAVIEHPQWIPEAWQARLDLYAAHDRGRIYRIRRKDSLPVAAPRLDRSDLSELVRALADSNGWRRDTAQQLLLDRGIPAGDPAWSLLTRLVADEQTSAAALVQLGWTARLLDPTLTALAGLEDRYLGHSDPRVVRNGIRIFPPNTLGQVRLHKLADHPDSRVRFEIALAAEELEPADRVDLLAKLSDSAAEEKWLTGAVLSSAGDVAGDLLARLLSADPAHSGHSETEPRARNSDQLLNGLLATAVETSSNEEVLRLLSAIVPSAEEAVPNRKTWQSMVILLEGLARHGRSLDQIQAASVDPTTIRRIEHQFELAITTSGNSSADVDDRVAAIALTARRKKHLERDLGRISELLSATHPPQVQVAAASRLAQSGRYDLLVEQLPELSPQAQSSVQTLLISERAGRTALLQALQASALSAADLTASTRASLLTSENSKERDLAEKLLSVAGTRDDVLARYADVEQLQGDPEQGRQVFARTCGSCHQHGEIGTELGPRLSARQDRSVTYLVTAILDPNRSVDSRYKAWMVVLVDGRQLQGMIVDETATSVELATADGTRQTLLRRDIELMKASSISFMPEGLEKDLSIQQVADIVAFLQTDP